MKKLVLLLFLVLLVRFASAELVGCCCNSAPVTSDGLYPMTTQDICTDGWVEFGELQPGQTFFDEFQEFCSAECGDVIITPPTSNSYSISGMVVDVNENNAPVPDVDIFVNLLGSTGIGYTQTNDAGRFILTNIPQQDVVTLWAVNPACTTGTKTFSLKQNVDNLIIDLDCSVPSCPLTAVGIDDVSPSGEAYLAELTPNAEDIASISEECLATVEKVFIDVCIVKNSRQDCKTLPYSSQISDLFNEIPASIDLEDLGFGIDGWLDNLPTPNFGDDFFEVSFKLGIKYPDGWAWSEYYDKDLGEPECWNNDGVFCYFDYANGEDAIVECNENLRLVEPANELCEGDSYCSVDSRGDVQCKKEQPCYSCNSISFMFPDIFRVYTTDDNPVEVSCTDLVDDEALGACFKAGSPTAQDYYEKCSAVENCYDYTTQYSCELTPCGNVGSSGCSWKAAAPEVLGKGICIPSTGLDCTQCDDVYGDACTKEFCEGLGCASGYRGETQVCLPKERFACVNYETQEECIGDSEGVVVDTTYSAGLRTGGTNKILNLSDDLHGKGICLWGEDSDGLPACIRDADGDGEKDECAAGFLDVVCESDNIPPVTYLTLEANQAISLEDLQNVEIVVTDNVFSSEAISTYFCLTTVGSTCYPDSAIDNLNVDVEGRYVLRYYSEDIANNLEVVRTIPVNIIDTSLPGVKDVRIIE